MSRFEIPTNNVRKLIKEQFPKWADLPISPVKLSGWDNRTFHLGETMLIRMPSGESYVHQVQKEQKWLPQLGRELSFPIPVPVAMGSPSVLYPWEWSIYKWIEGENADNLKARDYDEFAVDLAMFLKELHQVSVIGAPGPGPFFRGASPVFYDKETRSYLSKLKDDIDVNSANDVWEKAIGSQWENDPVWVHGDLSSGNILIKNGKLKAVIDFGCCAVGDPACDLVIAWTFLTGNSRKIFKENLKLDQNTWARAKGWPYGKQCTLL